MRSIQQLLRAAVLASSTITITYAAVLPASPLGPENVYAVHTRTLAPPTVDACKAQLKVPPDTTLFYSGGPTYYQMAIDAINTREYLDGYEIMAQKWRDETWKDPWLVDEDLSRQFWDICSRALAEATSGVAYVLLPKGTGTHWANGTVWDRMEWPNIADEVAVIRINPDDPEDREFIKTGVARVLD
ncbi:hypothetical protein F4821DRAFT_275617 [Hypoxylon rubiginosum]|uniref:Uncharacterized protein n=1 Tax=Hypoxylon rubiginosum TaxID=110542 RepID=A0ACC0CKJ5_9PEZI|nr:hypothetical protein F4821DRAFT_275617 [Hypoxylon rubiginosum]